MGEPGRVELREGFHAALPYKGSMRSNIAIDMLTHATAFVDQSFTHYAARALGPTTP